MILSELAHQPVQKAAVHSCVNAAYFVLRLCFTDDVATWVTSDKHAELVDTSLMIFYSNI